MHNNILKKLEDNSNLIDTALDGYFPSENGQYTRLVEAQRYAILGGGKRIRAFLLMQVCRLLGGVVEAALPYACALEMIHTSSLIHDDMPCMDNDDYRRGKLATHKAYGETLALLTGDALMVKAFEVAIDNPSLSLADNAKAVKVIAQATGDCGMLEGQTIDTANENGKLTFQELLRLHELKTGRLVVAAAKLGCIAAKIDESDSRFNDAIKYAENIGLAFQIIDDILDYKDGQHEENSFVSFLGIEEAQKYADRLTASGIEAIKSFDDGILDELALYLTVRKN